MAIRGKEDSRRIIESGQCREVCRAKVSDGFGKGGCCSDWRDDIEVERPCDAIYSERHLRGEDLLRAGHGIDLKHSIGADAAEHRSVCGEGGGQAAVRIGNALRGKTLRAKGANFHILELRARDDKMQ